jgi:hypothetical protein
MSLMYTMLHHYSLDNHFLDRLIHCCLTSTEEYGSSIHDKKVTENDPSKNVTLSYVYEVISLAARNIGDDVKLNTEK